MPKVRPCALAGSFYPSSPEVLEATIRDLLSKVKGPFSKKSPKAFIVPHAGYIYSGPIAATAYAAMAKDASQIRKVVMLGPAHREYVEGLALPDADWLDTPLGPVEVDEEARTQISDLPQVKVSGIAHSEEHSLEVQLPFLKEILREFKILPLLVGKASPEDIDLVLQRVWNGNETLILVSSDLSHYLPYEKAFRLDRESAQAVLRLEFLKQNQACGASPINGFLKTARRYALEPHLLDLRNSGDTAGGKNRVVGYGAFAFVEGRSSG